MVRGLRPRRFAISRLVNPVVTSFRTSISRRVRGSRSILMTRRVPIDREATVLCGVKHRSQFGAAQHQPRLSRALAMTWSGGLGQPVFHRVPSGGTPMGDVQLAENLPKVGVNCAAAQEELVGELGVG